MNNPNLQKMRTEHLRAQHSTEEQNQQEYTARATESMRKKHAVQSRNHPKELKAKEAQIRKQFRQAMKTQTLQFKLLDKQMREALGRDEYREATMNLRDEQKRKTALLAEQYEASINEMVDNQTVGLVACPAHSSARITGVTRNVARGGGAHTA
jgi:thousand and one amino acid protein kinase